MVIIIFKGIPRTTNLAEAYHRCLNAHSEVSQPNIDRSINLLQKEEEIVRFNILQPNPKNKEKITV